MFQNLGNNEIFWKDKTEIKWPKTQQKIKKDSMFKGANWRQV